MANIFDKVHRAIIRHSTQPGIQGLSERAKLFYIGQSQLARFYEEHEGGTLKIRPGLRKDFDRLISQGFFLPYQDVAMIDEEDGLCVMLGDDVDKCRGSERTRLFIAAGEGEIPGDIMVLTGQIGGFRLEESSELLHFSGVVVWDVMPLSDNEDTVFGTSSDPRLREDGQDYPSDATGMLIRAIHRIIVTNLPNHFIVQESTVNRDGSERRQKGLLPSEKRPRLTILRPQQILRRLPSQAPNQAAPQHKVEFRRAHDRFLAAACFTNMRGQTIAVSAVWNRETEWTEEDLADATTHKRYQIILDR